MDDNFDYASLMGNICYTNLDLNNNAILDMFSNSPGSHPYDLQAVPFSDILDMPSGPLMPDANALAGIPLPYDNSSLGNGSNSIFSNTAMTSPTMSNTTHSINKVTEDPKAEVFKGDRTEITEAQMRSLFPEPNEKENPHGHRVWKQDWLVKSQQVQILSFPNRSVPQVAKSGLDRNSSISASYNFNDLRIILEQPLWPHAPMRNPLTRQELENLIEIYFTKFQPHYTMVHRPTFVLSEVPVVLMLAMATLGACLGAFEGSSQLADCLGEWTRRLLIFLAEYNPQ